MNKDISEYLKPEKFNEAFAKRRKMRVDTINPESDPESIFGINPESVFGIIETGKDDVTYSSIIKLDNGFITKTSSGFYLLNGVFGPKLNYLIDVNKGLLDYDSIMLETMKRHNIKKRHFGWGKKWVEEAMDETRSYIRSQLVAEIQTNPFSEKFKDYLVRGYELGAPISRIYTKNQELEFLMK